MEQIFFSQILDLRNSANIILKNLLFAADCDNSMYKTLDQVKGRWERKTILHK